uniref:hypothetical protein n=1 Tax=Mycobacterium sp. UM_Kg1 TaxID=1545691 RepID=UPI000AD04B4E
MTWTKLSDDFSDDCWQLSDKAFRLHTEGLIWSNRKLLDLGLDKDDLRRWAKHPDAADELVACGWWTDEGDHYRIVHHGAYQRLRDMVLKMQRRNQQNGGRGGRPPTVPRERFATKADKQITEVGSQVDTQVETDRDGTGRDGPGLQESGTARESSPHVPELCADCAERPPAGEGWDPTLCRSCLYERLRLSLIHI